VANTLAYYGRKKFDSTVPLWSRQGKTAKTQREIALKIARVNVACDVVWCFDFDGNLIHKE